MTTFQPLRCHPRLGQRDEAEVCSRTGTSRLQSSSTSRNASAARHASLLAWSGTICGRRLARMPGFTKTPPTSRPDMFTLMRFTEWDNPKTGNLEWLIRKDGCMHCEDPACLKACPSPGAIVQYANGIVDFLHGTIGRGSDRNCLGMRLLRKGVPVQHPAPFTGR